MRKNFLFLLFLLLIVFLSSCISFEKQSPLETKEYLEGMPLILEFARPIIEVEIYEGDKLIYKHDNGIIYELKTNFILHNDVTVKITEFSGNKKYVNVIKKIKPDMQFLLYVGADNDLDTKDTDPLSQKYDYFIDLDIYEIKNSVQKSNINVVVNIISDRYNIDDEIVFISNLNGKYLEYEYSTNEFGFGYELSSASTETLYKFLSDFSISDTIKVLDLWDHGNGWALESKSILSTKAIIQEGNNDRNSFRIRDIKDVLEKYNNNYNFKIDILAFDACNMTSLEIMYEFKDLVDYFIGSVYTVARFGFYYDFFHNLDDNNLVESLVYNIIAKYNYYYTNIYYLDRLSLVGVKLKGFNWSNINNIDNVVGNYDLYKNDGRKYVSEPTDMIDVNNLILSTGENLSNYVTPAIINSVVRIDGIDYHNYSGIGIMFEDIFYNNDNYEDYKALTFYNDFQDWIETTWKSIIKNH
ncbi:clostripain-related cysteine peptidase [Marinitoga litoralis]|uniref:clostripain-related cysteine peptidase n=1 Tax=Marinitoga litoralis TaxID=570855 RepID=UPI00195F88D0|nr:clostripain-related cysteine peptidase [Marinitoga litoralis]MBM7560120.1 hypothetical protein [Marinitoga litoralis]